MTPIYQLTIIETGKDLTALVQQRAGTITIADNRGFEADTLEITLSDHDGRLTFPSRTAQIGVKIGFKETGLVDKGFYNVDEIEWAGAPDVLTIRAKSADLKGSLSTKKERSFHETTIGELIKQFAAENQLKPLCDKSLSSQTIEHIDQQNESTIHFLSRLAEQYDAIATVKNGYLMFIKAGQGKTASGSPIPPAIITKNQGDQYRFSVIENQNYTAVRAYWHNLNTGQKGEVIIDENGKTNASIDTDANQMQTIRHVYRSEKAAITGAKAAFDKIKRGVATFSLTLAVGNPELIPEQPATIQGFKGQIDNTEWIITKVTHNLGDNGYTCQLDCELKI